MVPRYFCIQPIKISYEYEYVYTYPLHVGYPTSYYVHVHTMYRSSYRYMYVHDTRMYVQCVSRNSYSIASRFLSISDEYCALQIAV